MARDLALERRWRKWIRQYERSGLTVQAFCEREGLVAHQFYWWRRELRRRAATANSTGGGRRSRQSPKRKNGRQAKVAAADFVPVQIELQESSAVEVVLERPPRIRISSGFDAELLQEVVRVLETR